MGMSSASTDKASIQSSINATPLIDVLLVLLIIFLVVMPIMMKMETLDIPRALDPSVQVSELPVLLVKLKAGGDLVFTENDKDTSIAAADLMRTLRPRLEASSARGLDRVVFVDFDEGVAWASVVSMMDSIRSLAEDVNHDGIKVALKVRDELKAH